MVNSLWMESNKFSGSLPPEFQNLTAIRDLNLYNNYLTGIYTSLKFFPFYHFTSLFTLGIHTNINTSNILIFFFTGNIPKEIG